MLTRLVEDAKVKAIHRYTLYICVTFNILCYVHVVLIICIANKIFFLVAFYGFLTTHVYYQCNRVTYVMTVNNIM